MSTQQEIELLSTVIATPHPKILGDFYAKLLDWNFTDYNDDWVKIISPKGNKALSFQIEKNYKAPDWPIAYNQQMMMHVDFGVDDMTYFSKKAIQLGARVADYQPQEDVIVMLDPDGHPFCLFLKS